MTVTHKENVQGDGAVFGKPIQSPAAWTAPQALAQKDKWIYVLTDEDKAEIVAAAKHAVATRKEVPDLTPADFPLPKLSIKLQKIKETTLSGIGFHLIRGFPVEQFTRQEVVTAFAALGTYWGNLRSQNAKGHVVGHVKDLGLDPDDDNVRIYSTRAPQPYHVDDTDLVALLCLKTAKSGGRSGWASSINIYNRLLERRPDLLQELVEPFPHDRKNEEDPGERPFYLFPVFSFYKGYLTTWYNPRMTAEAQRFPDAPRLTPKKLEALQLITEIAEEPENHLEWELERGDVQLLHNWTQLHMRTAYVDHEGFENRRHLLRLWLSPEDGRPLDPKWYGTDKPGYRQGIYKAGVRVTATLDAE